MADAITTSLQTAQANWAAALATDSISPQPSYSVNGVKVDQNEWRTHLENLIDAAQKTINARNPYFIQTRAYVRGC